MFFTKKSFKGWNHGLGGQVYGGELCERIAGILFLVLSRNAHKRTTLVKQNHKTVWTIVLLCCYPAFVQRRTEDVVPT